MSRGRSTASRIMSYFQTAPENEARLIFGLVRDAITERFGKQPKAPKAGRPRKQKQTVAAGESEAA